MHVEVTQLHAFCLDHLLRSGVDRTDAELMTDVLITTDTWGVFTHGIKSLGNYLKRLEGGGLQKKGNPVVTAEGPAWAQIDGGSSLGMTTSTVAMDKAVEKARETGIGFVGVRNSCHFGAAGYYAVRAAKQGLIGICMANDIPGVAAPDSKGAVLGTNPFAYAIPTGDEQPIFLDIATSAAAGGKVIVAAFRGDPIPEEWAQDPDGLPTTDPHFYPLTGALQAMAQHKGYGIALMIEILSATLTGAAMTHQVVSWSQDDPSLPTGHGAAFIAIDVASMMDPGQFRARLDALRTEIRAAPAKEALKEVRLPGDREWKHRENALKHGITLPDHVAASVRSLAEERNLPLGEYFG